MILTGPCLKCGETVKLDIGEQTKAQAISQLAALDSFTCTTRRHFEDGDSFACTSGLHIESGSPYPQFWELDKWDLVEGQSVAITQRGGFQPWQQRDNPNGKRPAGLNCFT